MPEMTIPMVARMPMPTVMMLRTRLRMPTIPVVLPGSHQSGGSIDVHSLLTGTPFAALELLLVPPVPPPAVPPPLVLPPALLIFWMSARSC